MLRVSINPRSGSGRTRLTAFAVALALCSACACERDRPRDEVLLRIANWGGPANDPVFLRLEREIREEFMRLHPGVRVELEQIPGIGQYEPKLMMMFVADRAPDVFHLDASSAALFIDNDTLLDLRPFLDADPEVGPELYFETVLDITRRGEAIFALPLDFTPMVMYYNKRLFDAAGVPYPQEGWTWAEFLDKCQRLTVTPPGAAAPTQFGFCYRNWMPGWAPWLWNNGGDVLSPDGRHAVGYFDGPRSVEALRFFSDLVLRHHVAPTPAEAAAAGVDLFRAGRAAMYLTGHWSAIEYRADGMDFGIVGLPSRTGESETVVYAASMAVSRKTRHPQLAWEYVKFLTSAEVQKKRLTSGVAISGNREAAQHFAVDPIEQAFLDQVPRARPPWGARVEIYPFLEDLGREMMEDVLYGRARVDEAAERTAKLMEAALARTDVK